MFCRIRAIGAVLLLTMLAVLYAGSGEAAENVWRVSKLSGEVSVTTSAGEQAALTDGATIKPGDSVRTGQTGRVLLTRGEETMLVSPNSAIGIPAEKKSDLSTTIIQQAGSILLDVEKRNVKHFAVETPYLAAVVKGTQFRVTVNKDDSRVDVIRGQVEVSDFKSGKYALVQPGQAAQVSAVGTAGLSLSGVGSLSPVQQGTPRVAMMNIPAPTIAPNALPARTAPAEVQPAHTWSSASSGKDTSWSSSMPSWSKGLLGGGGKNNRNDDIALAAAISCAVGFIVAIGVGAQRRRKSRKQELT